MSTTAKEYKKNNVDTDADGYLYTGVKIKEYKTPTRPRLVRFQLHSLLIKVEIKPLISP